MISLTMSREDWRTGSIPELSLLQKQKFKTQKGEKNMDLNQIKIVDGKLFLDDTEVKGIQKINLQKGIDIYKTSLKIEMIVGSPLDELEPKNRKYEVILRKGD
ncbi:Phage protein [Lactococcus lactis]|nr:Phage protein [Lactococcus lactis]